MALAMGATHAATIEQPRAFGHVLGDVLTQRVLLQVDGREVSATAVPPPQRVGPWFERRPARTERDGEGRRWLAIDYQVINSPRSLATETLPPLSIPVDTGSPITLPEWPVSIGPLAPAQVPSEGALLAMRPDREVAPLPTAPVERQLKWSAAALSLVVLAWLGWWSARQWRDARRLPFARAMTQLRRLPPGSDEAWLAMHRAIDACAGRVVRSESLPALFAEAPHLGPMRARLEDFYRCSDQHFFAGVRGDQAYPLLELCRALRKAEQSHHSLTTQVAE